MRSPQYPLRYFILGLVIIISSQIAAAQTCAQATAVAQTWLSQLAADCTASRTTCGLGTQCGSECLDGGDSYTNSCVDGCNYQWNGYTVQRITSGSYGASLLAGHTHTFTAGASGTITWFFEAYITDNLQVKPARGAITSFSFNGSPCVLEQRYCDTSPTTIDFYVDCTSVDGVTILDFCLGTAMPDLTTESSLIEILYRIPSFVCQSEEAPSGVAPNSAPNGSPGTPSNTNLAPNDSPGTPPSNNNMPAPSQNESPGIPSSAVNNSWSFFAIMAGAMLVALVVFV